MAAHCTQCGEVLATDARFCPSCGTPVIVVATPSKDPLLGQIVADRYLVQDKIGQGRSGTIYRAEHTTLHRKMAVKILHHTLSRDEAAIERFRREATTIGQIDNDHLLQIFDFGRTADQRLFFAMELLDGETLDAVLEREEKLEPERAGKILRQLADALREAHQQGYVHRDLRPRNVFLSVRRGERDFVKLLDFGLAKLVLPEIDSKQTALGMTFGDARYMSPEQARGDAIDERSDVYSIGVVGYQMLTGKVPFTGNGPFEILQKVLSTEAPRVRALRPDCPSWLDELLERCLARDPARRFADMGELMLAMERRKEPRPEPVKAADPEPDSDPESEEMVIDAPYERPTLTTKPVPLPDAPNAPIERDQTNPGWKQGRTTGVRYPIPTDSVSGEVTALPRAEKDEAQGPSIVIDASMGAEHGESTGPQSPSALRATAADVPMPDLPMQGEPSGPQRRDDAWFGSGADEELEPAPQRGRGPLFIAAIAGAVAISGIATIALWPHPKPPRVESIAPAPPVVAQAPPVPVVTPVPVVQPQVPEPPKPVAHVTPAPVASVPVVKDKPVPAVPVVKDKPVPAVPVVKDKPVPVVPVVKERPAPVVAVAPVMKDKPAPVAQHAPIAPSPDKAPHGFVDPFATDAKKGGQADALIKSGRQKLASGDTGQAQALFTQARTVDPKNADAVAGLAEVSFESGDYGNAAAMLRQALRLSPNRARYLVLLGDTYYKQGKAKDSVAAYRQALKVDPTNQEAQRSLDLAVKKLGNP